MTALQDNALSQAQRNAEEYIINNGVAEVAAGADGWDLIRRNYTTEQIEKIMARFVQNAPDALSMPDAVKETGE